MSKQVTTTSESGFASTSDIGGYELAIDGAGEETPDTLEHLLATYAACYVVALRVAAKQRNVGELGNLEIDAVGELNEDDKFGGISFDITTEEGVDEDRAVAVIERANALCKVHDALKSAVKADVTLDGTAA